MLYAWFFVLLFIILPYCQFFPSFILFLTFKRFLSSDQHYNTSPRTENAVFLFYRTFSYEWCRILTLALLFLYVAFLQTLSQSQLFPYPIVPEISKSRCHWYFSPSRESNARSFLSRWGVGEMSILFSPGCQWLLQFRLRLLHHLCPWSLMINLDSSSKIRDGCFIFWL